MAYRIQELVRSSLVSVVTDWFDSDKQLFAIYVDTIRGRGRTTTHSQKGEFQSELLDGISPEYFVDQVVDGFSEFGQKLQLRAVFVGEDNQPNWDAQQTKRFSLVPETPGTRTGSQGNDAATERLSQSLSSGFDTLVRRQEESQERQLGLIQANADNQERYFDRLMNLQADGSNTVTSQAIQLQAAVSRNELLEFKLQILQESSETSLGSMLLELAPHLFSSPLATSFAQLMGAAAKKWNSEAEATSALMGPSESAPASEPATKPPEGPSVHAEA